MCTQTGRHLATFTRRPGSSPYTLATEPPQVAASAQVSASGPVAPPCSCRFLSHQTLLWHHRLGHPSLPCLRGMHSHLLVSCLSRSLPPLPPSPAPPCLPCVEGRQRAAPHSSSFPPRTAPLQTLHMDGEVPDLLIPWIRVVRLQLSERFRQDLPILHLHSDRGGEFSSDLLWEFCRGEGILQTFTLPASSQQNGVAEHRIGLVMEVARTSMIHAADPNFLWTFAVQYAAHQLSLWARVSLPETSPTLRWTGKVGDASVFWVWGSRALIRDPSADKLSSCAIPCVFLGFPPDAPGWQFYYPTSRRVLPRTSRLTSLFSFAISSPTTLPLSPPYRSSLLQVDPLPGTMPVEVTVDSGAARGAASRGAASGGATSGGAEPASAEPGGAAAEGAEPWGVEPEGAWCGGVEPGGAEPGGTEPEGAEPGGAESEGAESRGAKPRRTESTRGPARASPRAGHSALAGTGAGGARATRPGGAGVTAGATSPGGARTRGTGAAGAGGVGGAGARGTGAGGAGAEGAGAGDPGAGGARAGGTGTGGAGAVDPGVGGTGAGGAGAGGTVQRLLSPPPHQSQPQLQPNSPLPAPSPYAKQTDSFTEHREPESRPALPVRAVRTRRRVPHPRPPPDPGTHVMALCPSSVPLQVHLLPPPASSLPAIPDHESDLAHGALPTVPRLLATIVTDPSFESTAASALVAEPVNFAAAYRLDYATSLVAQFESDCPPSFRSECALGTNVLEDRQEDFECFAAAVPHFVALLLAPEGDPDATDIPTPRSYAEAITGPYKSQWQKAMDVEMASKKSTGTYVDAVPSSRANIVDGMWIFRVKRPPGSPPVFKARYVARGFSQRQGVDFFQTFTPTPKMTTLRVLLHVAAQHDYELHSLDFSTTFLQGSLHKEIWLRRPPGFTGSFPASTQWSLWRPVYGLRQAPREWHVTPRTTLAALGFAPSTADPSLFLRTDTSLPPFYVLVYVEDLFFATVDTEALALVFQRFGFRYSSPQSTPLPTGHLLSAPPSDESVEPSGPYLELVGCLMYLMTCTRPDLTYPLSILARYVAPVRHRPEHWEAAKRGYTFSLGSGSVSWRSARLSSVLSSTCEAEIYAGAMAAQELRWLTYVLTDLGERPRSSSVMYVDNKAMISLCQENGLEHRMKHIALRYFLAQELQQRGQLRLAYVATWANTVDIFSKALQTGDHQRFCNVIGLVPTFVRGPLEIPN
ncbi:unnamed protein product [Closterium sp. NIES-53]